MKHLAHWAWVVVLGTALALSWWSLDTLARHYGMPAVLAAMVSATFDGAALVAADLGLRRAAVADAAAAVKLLMCGAVGLSAWLNYEHGLLLGYPVPIRVLFAAPSVIGGWLFELQVRQLHRVRLHELGRTAQPLPRFGFLVWVFHPWGALQHLSRIAGSRLRSVPVTVLDWTGAPTSVQELPGVPAAVPEPVVILAAPVEPVEESTRTEAADEARTHMRAGRTPVPDALYVVKLRELVEDNGDVIPSAREVARRLGVGQDRARRLATMLHAEREAANRSPQP